VLREVEHGDEEPGGEEKDGRVDGAYDGKFRVVAVPAIEGN
jgi:hypothetical protein